MIATRHTAVWTGAILLLLAAAAWYVAVTGLGPIGMMDMSPPIYLATWVTMIVAMMFPAVAPVIVTFGRVSAARRDPRGTVAVFVCGYLAVWAAAGVLPLALFVSSRGMVAGMSGTPLGSIALGIVLLSAGLYQLTPWKAICLSTCRSPLGIVINHDFGSGMSGALRAGASHGAYCLGCCWALMSLLMVVGLMTIPWMAGLSVLFLAEKNWRYGAGLSRIAGAAAALGGLAVLIALAL
jgi:predicted metal-binding membrane protein